MVSASFTCLIVLDQCVDHRVLQISAAISEVLQGKLKIDPSRFYLKVGITIGSSCSRKGVVGCVGLQPWPEAVKCIRSREA